METSFEYDEPSEFRSGPEREKSVMSEKKDRAGIERREFVAAMAGVAIGAGFTGVRAAEPTHVDESIPRPPQVPLGKTGITMSRVGQGTGMRGGGRQSNHTRMGFEKIVSLFRHDYERGVTFFDLADLYGTHVYFREALRTIPREKVAILTKLWWRFDKPPAETRVDFQRRTARVTLERFRHEISTDYLDIVLLHCMTTPKWEKELAGYMEALAEAKEKKQVRAVGVSCHNLEAMKVAAESPWVDVILARINPHGVKMDGTTDEVVAVLRRAKENGKALIGMKIYGEGQLADRRDECMRFAQNLGLLDAMTLGAETKDQMDETLRLLAKYPAAAQKIVG